MASVHYLIEDVNSFRSCLYNKSSLIQKNIRKRVLAAICIQCYWRGYCVRKNFQRLTKAAIIMQKTYKGWIIRWRMPQILTKYITYRNGRLFDKMATRISSVWRGYWARKNLTPGKNMVKRRLCREKMKLENENMSKLMSESINRLKHGPKSKEQIHEEEEQCHKWVLYILHKCHHLIRTKHIPGIYSDNSKDNLTFVEYLLKLMPMKDYMDHVKKEFYDMQEQIDPKTPYVFEKRAVQRMEDAFKLRYKLNDVKSVSALIIDKNINKEKPFILSSRTPETPYEKLITYEDKFRVKTDPFSRVSEPELFISENDFVLTKKIGKKVPDVPPYYIDNWQKPKCKLHYPVYMFGD